MWPSIADVQPSAVTSGGFVGAPAGLPSNPWATPSSPGLAPIHAFDIAIAAVRNRAAGRTTRCRPTAGARVDTDPPERVITCLSSVHKAPKLLEHAP